MNKGFFVQPEHKAKRSVCVLLMVFLAILAACAPETTVVTSTATPETCDCELTTGRLTNDAPDGSIATVNVDTCMEPPPCVPEELKLASFNERSPQFTDQMEEELKDKGDVYALLDVQPDGKIWDPPIEVLVILRKPAPRDNFQLSILRWAAPRWQKEGTAVADNRGDEVAFGKIGHTSLFAFVDETAPNAVLVTVPNVTGLILNEAIARLRAAGLEAGPIIRRESGREADVVIGMAPGPGSDVEEGDRIELVVSTAPLTVPVPPIIGLSQPAAEAALEDAGLFVSGRRHEESEAQEDTVIDAIPGVGKDVEVGSGIYLVLASTIPEATCEVMDVIGYDLDDAVAALADTGCVVAGDEIGVESGASAGTVIDMQPDPGTEVPLNSSVDLYYAVPEPCQIPNVVGYTLEEAIGILGDTECLYVGEQIGVESAENEGIVVDMEPDSGAEVAAGTAVDLYYAVAEPCQIPNLVGYALEEAIGILGDTDCLYVGEQIGVESAEYEGTVVDTQPDPGAEVAAGTAVDLYYAVAEPCQVPDVIGYYLEEAMVAINETGCVYVGEQIGVESTDYEGTVIDMSPGPGSEVPAGSPVDLYYATAQRCEVPDVVGYYRYDAEAIIVEEGCTVGKIIEVPAEEYEVAESDIVVDTVPEAYTVIDRWIPVDIYVTVTEKVEVPDVIGDDIEEASYMLAISQLETGEIIFIPGEGAPGTVVNTEPMVGMLVDKGSPVDLYVLQESLDYVTVPELTGQTIDNAKLILDEVDLIAGEIIEIEPTDDVYIAGVVRYTDPEAGAEVLRYTAINLYVTPENESPEDDYSAGYQMGENAVGEYSAFSAIILYQESSAFSYDRMLGFSDGFAEAGGEIVATFQVVSTPEHVHELLQQLLDNGYYADVIYFPVQEPTATYIAEAANQLLEEYGLETILLDAYGWR